jgi:hypothetical protein
VVQQAEILPGYRGQKRNSYAVCQYDQVIEGRRMNFNSDSGIQAHEWYGIRDLCRGFRTGRKSIDRAINRGELRAVRINERGDRRVRGADALSWVESRVVRGR